MRNAANPHDLPWRSFLRRPSTVLRKHYCRDLKPTEPRASNAAPFKFCLLEMITKLEQAELKLDGGEHGPRFFCEIRMRNYDRTVIVAPASIRTIEHYRLHNLHEKCLSGGIPSPRAT